MDFPKYDDAMDCDIVAFEPTDTEMLPDDVLPRGELPTWTHPYLGAELKLGTLGTVPVELLKLLITRLPIFDVATLSTTCRTLSQIIGSACSPYMPLLPQIGHALTALVDHLDVVAVLRSIETLPVPMRPEPLRTFASQLIVPGITRSYNDRLVNRTWDTIVADTRRQLSDLCSASDRVQHDVDLDVATWQGCSVNRRPLESVLCNELYARLPTYPMRYWPELLDAAVAHDRPLIVPEWRRLIDDATICFAGVSDALVRAFASITMLRADTYSVLQNRLGVTALQCTTLLHPEDAIKLAAWRKTNNVSFTTVRAGYPDVDRRVVIQAERIGFETGAARSFENGQRWERFASIGRTVFESELEGARWFLDASGAFSDVADSGTVASSPMGESREALTDAYIRLTRYMTAEPNALSTFNWIRTLPVVFQPVLMDRWASLLDVVSNDGTGMHTLVSIAQWREKTMVTLRARHQDNNAVRACVAEMRAQTKIAREERCAQALVAEQCIARDVFKTMPVTSWGAMLGYLAVYNGQGQFRIGHGELECYTERFLTCPNAGVSYTSAEFSTFLCRVAGQIFKQLPDKANGPVTKYDQFCNRFGIRMDLRGPMKMEVLRGVARGFRFPPTRLRMAIRDELKETGLDDRESFLTVLQIQNQWLQSAAFLDHLGALT